MSADIKTDKAESSISSSHSISQGSQKSKTKPRAKYVLHKRERWSSKWDCVSATMACTFSMSAYDAFLVSSSKDTGFTQYTIWTIFFCMPLIYMQMLLGQYTQLGTVVYKYLSPIGSGIDYVLISNLFLRTIKNSILLNDSVFYFMSSFRQELQWMNCSRRYKVPCWDITKNCTNCVNSTYYMPGYIYFYFHYLENPDLSATNLKLSLPPFRKGMAHLVCWAFTSVVLMLATNHYIRAVKTIWCICLGFLMLLILGCAAPDGKGSFLDLLLVGTNNITNISSWTNTLSDAITLFGLGRAFHVVSGSHMAINSPAGLLSILIVITHSLLTYACSILAIVCINKIAHYTKTDADNLSQISWGTADNIYFYVLPQGLGFMGIPQLWSCVYFGLCILLNLNQQITHLIMMEKALSDIYPNLSRYTKYVLTFCCIFTCIVSSLFLSRESFLTYKEICYVIANNNEMFNVVVMCILVCWIYGVQRFSDDIHFITGRKTTKFWKICWYCLPIIAMAAHIEIMVLQNEDNDDTRVVDAVLYWVLGSPVPIMAIVQTFKFMRKRDLFGILRAEERFGPPERQERHLRRLFNPRKETKSKRRMQICQHPCLINNQMIKLIVASETTFREQCEEKLVEDYISDED